MKFPFRCWLAFSIVTILYLPLSFAEKVNAREMCVGIAVSPDMKIENDWENKFKQRLAYASQIFETEFKIKLRPVSVWDWKLKDEKQDSLILIEDLKNSFPIGRSGVDIVIGLTRLTDPQQIGNLNDLDTIGRARPFSGYLVLRMPMKPLYKIQEETALTHELAHLFGAIHTKDPKSIMSPIVDRQIPTSFDAMNRNILTLTREINFGKGLDTLNQSVVQRLLNSYLQLRDTEQSYDFYYSLGYFYLTLGQSSEALQAWKSALNLHPEDPQIHFDFGVLNAKLGRYDEAISELSDAVNRFSAPGDENRKASAYNWLGVSYFERGNESGAYQAWSQALVITPDDADLKINLAIAQMKRGQCDEAIRVFQRALQSNSRNPKTLSNLGFCYFQEKQYQKAVDYLKLALQAGPQQKMRGDLSGLNAGEPSVIYERLGDACMKMLDIKSALTSYQKSCELNPTIHCHQRLGEVAFQAEDWDGAIQELAGVLRAKKDDPEIYGMLGTALVRKGDFQKADGIFREGLNHADTEKSKAMLHRNLGHLYLQAKKFDAAEKELQLSIGAEWNSAESHLAMAYAQLALGFALDARQSLRNVLSIDPNNQKAKSMLAQLESRLR